MSQPRMMILSKLHGRHILARSNVRFLHGSSTACLQSTSCCCHSSHHVNQNLNANNMEYHHISNQPLSPQIWATMYHKIPVLQDATCDKAAKLLQQQQHHSGSKQVRYRNDIDYLLDDEPKDKKQQQQQQQRKHVIRRSVVTRTGGTTSIFCKMMPQYQQQQHQQQQRSFSTIPYNHQDLNANNMTHHHMDFQPQLPQEWTTMYNNVPVLQSTSSVSSTQFAQDRHYSSRMNHLISGHHPTKVSHHITRYSCDTDHLWQTSNATTKTKPSTNTKLKETIRNKSTSADGGGGGGNGSSTSSNSTVEPPRTSVLMELTDRVGVLHDVLRYFWKYDVNVCRIESRPVQAGPPKVFDFFVDMEGNADDDNIQKVLQALKELNFVDKLLILDIKDVHWFPRHISELDMIADRVLDAGLDLKADHPGFSDVVYRARRAELAEHAFQHKTGQPIDYIEYTDAERSVWTAVWDRMEGLWDQYACQEYVQALNQMQYHCGYSRDNIPQQQDISDFLQQRTGFRMRPVAGLLSSRDFLNALAFRVFCSTQYIRHASKPLYTPEPDIVHELLGHAPMLADPDFADFSQQIGLASLGASDEEVEKLARCYWHSVEFGICEEDGKHKAYGAGLLSSFGELEYACSDKHPTEGGGVTGPPEIMPWDPEAAAKQEFPITTYQPVYFLADSLMDAKQQMRRYCEDLPRPFFALHNAQTDSVHIDRPVQRTKGEVPHRATVQVA